MNKIDPKKSSKLSAEELQNISGGMDNIEKFGNGLVYHTVRGIAEVFESKSLANDVDNWIPKENRLF